MRLLAYWPEMLNLLQRFRIGTPFLGAPIFRAPQVASFLRR